MRYTMSNQSDNEKRADLVRAHLSPYRSALEQVGIGPLTVAKNRKQQLRAKYSKQIKMKGVIPLGTKLAPGYRVIIGGGVTQNEDGPMIFDDVLIEFRGIDWVIQERATSALEKIFDVPQKQIIEHQGSIAMTNFPPEPKSMEEWEEQYRRMREKKHGEDDPNASGA